MLIVHIAVTACHDYPTRREAHRRAHLERVQGLRAAGILIGAGPAPDGKTADLVFRLQQPSQVKHAVEEDPYWTGGVWTGYEPRSFVQFVEPWEAPPVVIDGSRRVTVVEGRATDLEMAQFALIEMRGAGRIAFGGFFEGGDSLAFARTEDAAEGRRWFEQTGFWPLVTTRPLLYVL